METHSAQNAQIRARSRKDRVREPPAPLGLRAWATMNADLPAASPATVTLGHRVMPSASLGPVNPLPPLLGAADVHEDAATDDLDDDMRFGLGYGKVKTVLPYLLQDGYSRELHPASHTTAVLENDLMRAEFLLGLGGRLWSLVDKRTGRELLHSNPVFRPANLALRNAWFAGGVEWNLGTTGHWPLTCSPLHAARVRRADGSESLRLYEYERMRGLVVRIDASLAPDAPVLIVSVTIRNPRTTEVPVYWWSNIAVPEREDVRVVTPADSAYHFGYEGILSRVPFPDAGRDGVDRSYTTASRDAADYFFELNRRPMPWIAALDEHGSGLFQGSTSRLRGRKLFLWGTAAGSTHWQRWLTDGEHPYLEIQAGIARTQLEHVPLPAGEAWRWTEAYGLAEADASRAHGAWSDAVAEAEEAVARTGAPVVLAREEARNDSDDEVVDVLQRASGWGALEDARRSAAGEPALSTPQTPFLASDLGPEQSWWLNALRGTETESDPQDAPASYQADPAWVPIVAAQSGWAARLHEGVLAAAQGRWDAAADAWRASVAERDNGWARRNLAVAALRANDDDRAAAAYVEARVLLPGLLPLTLESLRQLLDAGRPDDALRLVESLDATQRADGRVRFAEAEAALAAGGLERCGRLLDEGIEIADLKEGETSLDGLWDDYRVARLAAIEHVEVDDALRERAARRWPTPERYEFRMHAHG
jgi:tetratricopeptide (TPR) repeat protein